MILSERLKLILIFSIILLCAFITLIVLNYNTAQSAIKEEIGKSSLPLLRENIYSEIEKDILPALNIASSMANDYFLIEWVENNEIDEEAIISYLRKIHEQYGFFSTFFVSEISRKYYHFNGINKNISESDEHDDWYFNFLDSGDSYALDVDTDEAGDNALTIFINFRVVNETGKLLGVTGVGIKMSEFSEFLQEKQQKYNRTIFLTDSGGVIQAHSNIERIEKMDIRENLITTSIAGELLQNQTEPVNLDYVFNGEEIMISARYIPEINWFLIVIQRNIDEISGSRKILIRTAVIGLATTILIIALSAIIINFYHRRLEDAANTDPLTHAKNRRAFEEELEKFSYRFKRYNTSISMIMIDLDNFKNVNDVYGHSTGDDLLKSIANLIETTKRPDDFFVRWGGDEFVLLLEADIIQAKVLAERISKEFKDSKLTENIDTGTYVTLSIGITSLKDEDSDTFIMRADAAMYKAKQAGKNRIAVEL